MSIILSKRLKTALVLLCTMLIFFQIIPAKCSIRVCAAQNNSYEDDDDDYDIDDDDEYDEDDGDIIIIEDDDDDEDTDDQVNDQSQAQPQKQNQPQTVSQSEKKQEKDDKQSVKKAKTKQKKLTVVVSAKKRGYNDKLYVGDELKITAKSKNKKIKNKSLKFSSSKSSVVSVSADGVITAKKNGTARIKIVNKKKKSQKCFITVTVTKK